MEASRPHEPAHISPRSHSSRWTIHRSVLIVLPIVLLVVTGCDNLLSGGQEALQTRIDSASEGDVIVVDGEYDGGITIDTDRLLIRGSGDDTIRGDVLVTASDVTLDALRVGGVLETSGNGFDDLTLWDTELYGRRLTFTLSCAAIINPGEDPVTELTGVELLEGRGICSAPGRELQAQDLTDMESIAGPNVPFQVIGVLPPTPLSRIPAATGIDVVPTRIYWTDKTDNAIRRADLDGSDVEDLFIGPPHYFLFQRDSEHPLSVRPCRAALRFHEQCRGAGTIDAGGDSDC